MAMSVGSVGRMTSTTTSSEWRIESEVGGVPGGEHGRVGERQRRGQQKRLMGGGEVRILPQGRIEREQGWLEGGVSWM